MIPIVSLLTSILSSLGEAECDRSLLTSPGRGGRYVIDQRSRGRHFEAAARGEGNHSWLSVAAFVEPWQA